MNRKVLAAVFVPTSAIVTVLMLSCPSVDTSGGTDQETRGRHEELPGHVAPGSHAASDVDRLLKQMDFGALAFNAPDELNIEDSCEIQLLLSLSETVEALKRDIVAVGRKMGATVRVTDKMEAHLVGDMFQITPITPEIQAVSRAQRTEWRWEVRPKQRGRHRLHLTLNAFVEVDGSSTPHTVRTFSKLIEVDVTPAQSVRRFVETNWQWVWAAILVPLGGWAWKARKRKRAEKAKAKEGETKKEDHSASGNAP